MSCLSTQQASRGSCSIKDQISIIYQMRSFNAKLTDNSNFPNVPLNKRCRLFGIISCFPLQKCCQLFDFAISFLQANNYVGLVVFCIFFGMSYGMVGALQFEVLMAIVGTEKFSSAIGLVLLVEAVAVLVGPPGAGQNPNPHMYLFL